MKAKHTPMPANAAASPPLHAMVPTFVGPWAGQAVHNALTDLLPSQRLHFSALDPGAAARGWGIRPDPKHILLKVTAAKWSGQTLRVEVPGGASERAEWVRGWMRPSGITASEYQERAAKAAMGVRDGEDEAVPVLRAQLLHALAASGALVPLADAVWRTGDTPGAAFYIEGVSSLVVPAIARPPGAVQHADAGEDA